MRNHSIEDSAGLKIAADQLLDAAEARKCRACNCLGGTLSAIDKAVPVERQLPELRNAVRAAKAKAGPPEIECRGMDFSSFTPIAHGA